MTLPTKTTKQFTSDQITAFAGEVGISPNLKKGNIFRAIFQAASLGGDMFLQSQAVQTYQYARATSAEGPDLDSWMAQFGVPRLASTFASGIAVVGLSSVQAQSVNVQPGIIIQAVGGTPQYQIVADPARAAWSPSANAYVIPAGQLNIQVTVRALVAGTGSNVQDTQLTQFASGSAPLSTVTNPEPILNGNDSESDEDLRQRFIVEFNSVDANGTINAFLKAASGVQNGLDIAIVEFVDRDGAERDSFVLIIIDDGSGAPPQSLLDAVYTAVFAVRAAGIEIDVCGPILVNIAATFNLRIDPNANQADVLLAAENAVLDYVDTLAIAANLYISQVGNSALSIPGAVAIQPGSLRVNGAQNDLIAAMRTIYKLDNTALTIGTY